MNATNQEIKKGPLLVVLLVGAFLSLLNQTIMNVALPNLMRQFNISATVVQWLATGFMLVMGVLVPTTAFLMKRFTTRQLFISSMVLLFAGSFVCAIAQNFTTLLIGRMIQASGAALVMPLMMTVVLVVIPKERRGGAMGFIGLAMICAPAIGPTLAGLVIEQLSWRWLFIGLIPLVVVVILLSLKYLVNISEPAKSKLDFISVVLSVLGFGGILYGLSSAGDKGWGSPIVLAFLIGGLIFLGLFSWRQLVSKDPFLNIRVFGNKTFTMTTIINVLIMMISYVDLILLPIYLQTSRGFSVLDTGLLLLPGALLNAILSPLCGRLYDRIGAKPLVLFGLVFVIAAMWGVTDLSTTTSYGYLMVRTIILRFGLSFLNMPLNTAGLNALPHRLNAHGSAVVNTVIQLSGAIGTALVVTVMANQTKAHATELMQHVQSQAELIRDSTILGMNDAYKFVVVLGVAALLLSLFLRKRKNESASAVQHQRSRETRNS
ncbi:DHA2 family efflux MFS transporter permease subunit [Sporolactobacillus shoreicorticis]|uniref:DHA2 family efflux MFS transporter permease subunit n=1 Tax=Sporolactobacillus shoreicorticis TaxID=1923877 RepID=A0ABW5S1U7_9BACL|nr:DHA2 family efflux MFS transporter permease subunit [Sporolactobacillus shoreicorticis]MCO7124511.1 DHA2 family efflux MFS transporter permease subunit [Sporolactobacillus shoreicorticis]